jgi:hypothetical protein
MKLSHALILAASILLGCCLIAGSNLLFNRYEYFWPSNELSPSRIDRVSGTVQFYSPRDGSWRDVHP